MTDFEKPTPSPTTGAEPGPAPGAAPGPDPTAYGPSPTPYGPAPTAARRLVRRSDDKILGGVCSGIAAYFGVDVTLVRVLVVIGTLFGLGSLIVAYIAAWVLVPEA